MVEELWEAWCIRVKKTYTSYLVASEYPPCRESQSYRVGAMGASGLGDSGDLRSGAYGGEVVPEPTIMGSVPEVTERPLVKRETMRRSFRLSGKIRESSGRDPLLLLILEAVTLIYLIRPSLSCCHLPLH